MLVLSAADLATLRRHALERYPEECCGILLGRMLGEEARIERVVQADNSHDGSRERRYAIAPRDLLAAQKAARGEGRQVVGYYHSHPGHPAVPSARDREHAWPGASYLILSVEAGRVGEVRSWRLGADGEGFAEEAVG